MAAVVRNKVYLFFAFALLAVVLGGFARTYYLRYWFDVPPITMLLHAHSLVFTAWFALFVVQTRLIAAQNYRLHMRVGVAGVVLAALVVLLGIATAIISANAPRIRPMGLSSPQFAFVPLFGIVMFGALVAAAIAWRRKPQVHKRLMMLAMIVVLGPPVARLAMAANVGQYFLAVQTAVAALFVVICLVVDRVKNGVVHPIYAIGGTLLVLSWPARFWVAQTQEWAAIGRWLAQLTA
jgi:hypothetical protein